MNIQSNIRMSEQQYDAERSKFARTKKQARDEGGIRWEQQLATLFARSGWTTRELAKREKISQPYITHLIVFGQFLNFIAAAINDENTPRNLSEKRFRGYWQRTEERGKAANDRIRYKQVLELMRVDTVLALPPVALNHGPKIKEKFGDGKWYAEEAIAEAIEAPRDEIERALDGMWQKGSYGTKTERKRVGAGFHYRIFPQDKTISITELVEKLTPIIKELREEGGKHIARSVPITCAQCATRLQRLLDGWAE